MVECRIDGCLWSVERLWAHLNPMSSKQRLNFELMIPLQQAIKSFDPQQERGLGFSIGDYVAQLISEHGTYMADGLLRECCRINQTVRHGFDFIVVSIDDVNSDDVSLIVRGKVIQAS